MPSLIESPTMGMEQTARAALIILLETLNDELMHQEEVWEPLDRQLWELRGFDPKDFKKIELEPVETKNFYPGHVPSLIGAEIDKYPNVAVEADAAGSSTSDQLDQAATYGIPMFVEFMIKSEESAEEASARAHRMCDAIVTCIMSNRTLGGIIHELDESPDAQLTDVFVRDSNTSYGEQWFWRGGRIEFNVKKISQMPSGSLARPASHFDIDQA